MGKFRFQIYGPDKVKALKKAGKFAHSDDPSSECRTDLFNYIHPKFKP